MHKQDVEEATGRDVSSLRVRRPAQLDRDLGDVELTVYRATERLPRVRPGPQLQDDVGLLPPNFSTDSVSLTSRRWRTTA